MHTRMLTCLFNGLPRATATTLPPSPSPRPPLLRRRLLLPLLLPPPRPTTRSRATTVPAATTGTATRATARSTPPFPSARAPRRTAVSLALSHFRAPLSRVVLPGGWVRGDGAARLANWTSIGTGDDRARLRSRHTASSLQPDELTLSLPSPLPGFISLPTYPRHDVTSPDSNVHLQNAHQQPRTLLAAVAVVAVAAVPRVVETRAATLALTSVVPAPAARTAADAPSTASRRPAVCACVIRLCAQSFFGMTRTDRVPFRNAQ